ncbi:MAG: SIS domain-containing protein [Promethearchaeia archaeon]
MSKFWSEIISQPQALNRTYQYLKERKRHFVELIKTQMHKLNLNDFIFTGIGSSFFANYLPYYYLNQRGVHADMREAGEFLFYSFPAHSQSYFNNSVIVLTSQSGESGEIIGLLDKLRQLHNTPFLIGVTNTPNSTLDNSTELTLFTQAGNEETVTSKTYSSSLLVLIFLAEMIKQINALGKNQSRVHSKSERDISLQIKNVCEKTEKFFSRFKTPHTVPKPILNFLEDNNFTHSDLHFLARGPSLATAYQAALNAKEIAKIKSEANPVSTFNHGCIECLNNNSNLVFLSRDENSFKVNNLFINKLFMKMNCNKILHITNQKSTNFSDKLEANFPTKLQTFTHKISNPFLAPIMEIFPIQILLYKIAQHRNIEPGKFYYSHKITREI